MILDKSSLLKKIRFDFFIIFLIIPLIYMSNFLVSEISETLGAKQFIYIILGFFILGFFIFLPIRKLFWITPYIYWINIFLLVMVEFIGTTKLGAQRWIEIPLIGFSLQPSELIKPSFILMLAYIIKYDPPPPEGYGIKKFSIISFYIILPFILIAMQPDLGTASILLIVGFTTLFLIGIQWKIIASMGVLVALIIPIFYTQFMHDYQKKRIHDFLSDKSSYHVQQSIIAIGNGGTEGKLKEDATQVNFKFLPIASSDFIFSFYSERFGFVGSLLLVLLYFILIIHIFMMQFLEKNDYFLKTFSIGLSLLVFVYVSINIAMGIGYFPVVGVPLPFFSYGGSSFITFMVLFGILENLLAFRFIFMYNFKS
jgi:rod shape determining protein RodA